MFNDIRSVVVTVGTESWNFRRLFKKLKSIIPENVEVLWQTGSSDVSGLGIDGIYALPMSDLVDAARRADVVVAHSGIGSALMSLDIGKVPVLVPRRMTYNEAVNDHQVDIGRVLNDRGLCVFSEVDDLTMNHLRTAGSMHLEKIKTVGKMGFV
ncbi:glycosyltransferase [Sphingobium yanoikuyae]|jgi:UDP-N-acetylglucosamine transferase subunit ALG13|uniref:glycosyltransferase n=1 Tax=Sphingobium yanoikuyae TaxID=13690 RepID=UPI0014788084|nr:glycosyltransferase [Sphingobium yanoikuyae]